MRTAIVKSAETSPARETGTKPAPARNPLSHFQRAAGNQAILRAMSGGAPLPRELRSSLESYFKTPLDRVRVHADESSRSFADFLGARAFTVGQDIHLGSDGARATGSDRNELLAHEVVHTLQQGQIGPLAKMKVGAPNDSHERQADRISAAFSRGERAEEVSHVGAPVIQRAMHRVHYGHWEDHIYRLRQDDIAHKDIGLEMYLRFHPNENARADVIGLVQTAVSIIEGAIDTRGAYGQRQATSGPGIARAIDQGEGRPNPLYATNEITPRAGGDPTRLEDYATNPIVSLEPPVDGKRYEGYGRHGWGKIVNGSFDGEPAELYDAPHHKPLPLPDSTQVFETAALGLGGPEGPMYFGSVQWGWETDTRGKMKKLPFRVISQGAPSAGFLTAASLWNKTRTFVAYDVTASVTLYSIQQRPDGGTAMTEQGTLQPKTRVVPVGGLGEVGTTRYIEVTDGLITGYGDASLLDPVSVGPETVDLPIPVTHTVTKPAGSKMFHDVPGTGTAQRAVALPRGTRVVPRQGAIPTRTLHIEVTVVDGPHTGARGFVPVFDLTREPLGTR